MPSDCVIVLGARVHPDGRFSTTLRLRCEGALLALTEGLGRALILCGGQGRDEPVSEAQAMAQWFRSRGLNPAQLYMDPDSGNTQENLINAGKIMKEQGWTRAVIVTSDYHLTRALWLARDLGMEACGLSGGSPRRRSSAFRARLRETVSWIRYGALRLCGKKTRN